MIRKRTFAVFLLAVGCVYGQATITGIKLHTDPADARVRPFENVVIQVRVYGEAGEASGRIRRDGARVEVVESGGGWLSKPFHFQGTDDEPFIDQYQTRAGRIFGSLSGTYVMQDAVLYTAPEKPGDYHVRATLGGQSATATIHVDARAPSLRKPETISFPPEPFSLDPYRDLAEHYAPFLAQETWFQPKADYPTRFDFDGDWNGADNWEDMEVGTSQAYIYYAAMETLTHWFLIYNVFHPRDYSDKCVAGSCHENDNEGLILTVAKDGGPFGRLQAMETLAHNNVYSFTADRRVRNGVHDIDGRVDFYQDSHPVVFVESGGHGIYGVASSHARYEAARDRFTAGTGVTFVYKGKAERPRHANDRLVGYDLLPIYYQWWRKAAAGSWSEATFDDYFTYEPLGGRPLARYPSIGGAFLGRTNASNKAKPFWGWHDNRTQKKHVLATGQWGLDPAYAASRDLRFPAPYSTDYVFNPYLELPVNRAVASGLPFPRAPEPRTPEGRTKAPAPASPSHGQVEFRLWVDGSVEALIRGDRVQYYVISGAPYRDAESRFTAPVPLAPLRSLRLRKLRGRGRVEIVERPGPGNGYSTRIRIDDPKRSGGLYNLVLEWEK